MGPARRLAAKALARTLAVLAFSVSCAGIARPAVAAQYASPASLARWAGSFTYAGGANERTALERAIGAATADMGLIARHIARSRLEGEMRPDPRIVVRVSGTKLGIGPEGNWATVLDGPTRVFEEDGDEYRVRHVTSGSSIVQVIDGDSVRIRRAYTLSEDGSRLRVSVTFVHDRLSAPLRYELSYRRAS